MKYRDTADVLIAGEDFTYEFIKKAVKSISSCFKTRKIHLGMDEAGHLGSGKYYAKHGAVERKQILLDHLKRVSDIATESDLIPIIYGDIIYAVASGNQYAAADTVSIPKEVKEKLPKDLVLTYWNYYDYDYNIYKKMLESYRALTGKAIFWGGIWTWMGMTYDGVMTIKLTEPALRACKDTGIRNGIASAWQDDGSECNMFLSLHGLMYYAESMYNKEVDDALFKERFEYIAKADVDAFTEMSYFHNDYDNCNEYKTYHDRYMGKRYFWSDILLCLLDEDLKQKPMSNYYRKLSENYVRHINNNPEWKNEFGFIANVIKTLGEKCYIVENLRKAYLGKDNKFLRECADKILPELKESYVNICEYHRKEWYRVNKPYGFEVLDVRYGGIINRINTAILRLNQYLDGEVDFIEELESERLLHRCEGKQRRFANIMTASTNI